MSPALLAIIGAVVGAVFSGVIAFGLRLREERLLQRAAELLVRDELNHAARMLHSTLGTKQLWGPSEALPTDAWTSYRDRLVARLGIDTWSRVQKAVHNVETLNDWINRWRVGDFEKSPEGRMSEVATQATEAATKIEARCRRRFRTELGVGSTVLVLLALIVFLVLSGSELSTASLSASLRDRTGADTVLCDPVDKVPGQWLCSLTYATDGDTASAQPEPPTVRQELRGVQGDDQSECYYDALLDADGDVAQEMQDGKLTRLLRAGVAKLRSCVAWRFLGRLEGT